MIWTFYIRRMTANDVDDVFAVLNLNLGEYFAPEVIQFFLAQWPDGQFVAESLTGQVVGALCGSKLAGNRASVSLLAVDASVRGMGAGTSLMASLRRACMMNGIGTIQLEVRTTNEDAIRFYKRLGFSVSEFLPSFYNDGGDGYRMVSATFSTGVSPS